MGHSDIANHITISKSDKMEATITQRTWNNQKNRPEETRSRGRRKKEEGRRKERGRRKKEEGRKKKEDEEE